MLRILASFFGLFLGWVSAAGAGYPVPDCSDGKGGVLTIDNAQVLRWKTSTKNAFQARAYVEGRVSRVYPDRNGHDHFEIQIGPNRDDILEVVYNVAFGDLPAFDVGSRVGACGDYITSVAQTGPYPPSPAGAIIHWVHENTRGGGHPSGFVLVEGDVYGYPSLRGERGPDDRGNRRRGRDDSKRGGRNGFFPDLGFETVPSFAY